MVRILRITLDGETMADLIEQLHVVALVLALQDPKSLGPRLSIESMIVLRARQQQRLCSCMLVVSEEKGDQKKYSRAHKTETYASNSQSAPP